MRPLPDRRPLMAHLNFPPPSDHQAFERLIQALASPIFRTYEANRYGGNGQKQHGVDVLVREQDGQFVGIQCKLTVGRLAIGTVKAEVAKAEKFSPPLRHYVLATTAPSNAVLQSKVAALPQKKFSVEVWSWDEINNYINRHAGVAQEYVREVLVGGEVEAEVEHAEHLRIAIDRPAFLHMSRAERDFHAQREALKGTSMFLRTGLLYTRDGDFVTGLPGRKYAAPYGDLLGAVKKKVDEMDIFLARKMSILTGPEGPDTLRALSELDRKRFAVLDAANKALDHANVQNLEVST